MTLTEQIPAIIREARGKLTQVQAAADLGVNPQTWSRWERGETVPSLGMLEEMAREFDRDLSVVFKLGPRRGNPQL